MILNTITIKWFVIISFSLIGWFALPVNFVLAESSFAESKEQIQHHRANELRKQAKANAKASIVREDVFSHTRGNYHDELDYLGYQINRLGKLIRALSKELNSSEGFGEYVSPQAPPIMADPKNDRMVFPNASGQSNPLSMYGPQGPTEKSVRLLMEYRLMMGGNPRLKLGDVEEEKDIIKAHVLTVDDSIVQTYIIDKKTGAWKAFYK